MDEKEKTSTNLKNKVGEAQNKKKKFESEVKGSQTEKLDGFEISEEIKKPYIEASKNQKAAETRLKKWEEAINKQIEQAIKQGKIKDDDEEASNEIALKFLENRKGIISKVLKDLEKSLSEIRPEADVKKITETKTENVDKKIKIKFPKVANFPEKVKDKLIKLGLSEEDTVLFKKNSQGTILIYKKDKKGLHLIAEENKGKLTQNAKTKEAEKIEELPVKKLKEKYGDFLKKNLFNINHPQDWIYVHGYNEKNGEARIFDSHFEEGKKSRKITLVQLKELLKLYKKKETKPEKKLGLKKIEEVEKERAQKAQEVINNTDFDSDEENKPDENSLEKEDKEMEELQVAVEQARKNYALEDYKVTNILAKIRKVLGGNLHSTSGNLQETHSVYNQYKIALTELLDYQIEKLKEKNLPPEKLSEELEKLTKYFNQDEKLNLFDAHTEARVEILEKKFGKAPGKIAEQSSKFINWYRKLNWKKKIALSATAMLSGAGLLIIGQRMLGGVAVGVGTTAGLEGRYRRKEDKKSQKEQINIKEKLKVISDPEEKYAAFMESMQNEMDGYQKSLKTEKTKARNRKLIGATAAIFIGSGAASHLAHWGMDKTGASDYLSSHLSSVKKFWGNIFSGKHLGHHIVETTHKGIVGSGVTHHVATSNADHLATKPSPIPPQSHPTTPSVKVHEAVKKSAQSIKSSGIERAHTATTGHLNQHLNEHIASHVNHIEIAQKGDSVWKMIGKDLQTHSGKTFSALSPEQKTYVIDALKDNVAQHHTEFGLKNIDKIKVGQKIDLSNLFKNKADVTKIFEHAKHLTPDQLKNVAHNNEAILNWIHSHPSQSLDSSKIQQILSSKKNITPDIKHVTKTAAKSAKQIHTTVAEHLKGQSSGLPKSHPVEKILPKNQTGPVASSKIQQTLSSKKNITPDIKHVTKTAAKSAKQIHTTVAEHLKGQSSGLPKSHPVEKILPKNQTGPVLSTAAMGGVVGGSSIGSVKQARNEDRKNNIRKFPSTEKNTQETDQETKSKTLEGKFRTLTKRYKFNENDSFNSRAKKTIQAVSLNSLENWRVMKNIKFSELEKGVLSAKLVRNIKNLERDFVDLIGQQAKHRETETLKRWVARVVKISTNQEKENFKKAA